MLCGHGPNGKGEICPSVRGFAVLAGSGFTITDITRVSFASKKLIVGGEPIFR